MPFTPAHAIVALPFVRTPLLPAAIAIGAMTPDLPLFLRGTPLSYQVTHTNVLLSMLLASVLLVFWYALLRPAARELLPQRLACRLPTAWDAAGSAAWRAVRAPRRGALRPIGAGVFSGMVVLSLFLGVISHIAWDAFTHEGRWGTVMFPALADQWGPLAGYKWLQHASSVLALVVLAVFAVRWLARRAPTPPVRRVLPPRARLVWWLSLPLLLMIAWLWGLAVYGPLTATWTAQHLAYRVLPPACAAWGAATFVLCLVIVIRRRRAVR